MDTSFIAPAFEVAEAYISHNARTHKGFSGLRIVQEAAASAKLFWWGGTIPLVEVPLATILGGTASGYLLVSTSKSLPPILEFCLDGAPLSQRITEQMHSALWRDRVTAVIERFVFITSTEIYAEIKTPDSSDLTLFKVGDTLGVTIPSPVHIARDPAAIFDSQILDDQWRIMTPQPPPNLPEIILNNAAPVLYQQNCDAYGLECSIDLKTGTTYCSPHCIAGCVAVGWAMLLSSWKRTGFWDSAKIWQGSTCWASDWSSGNGPWVNACDQVNATIWQVHNLMGTGCDGATQNNRTIDGAKIFASFGMGWQYGQTANASFEFLRDLTLKGQPFLYTAQAHWNIALGTLSTSPQPGDEGHAVVVFGNRITDRMLYVALGWGSSFPYKWINYDQYNRVNSCFYLIGH